MKKIILSTLLTIFTISICFSQDIITIKSGEDISAKILEIGQTEIKYKKFDNQTGPIYSILKSDVIIVRYENGTKDLFNVNTPTSPTISNTISNSDNGNLFLEGQLDAVKYYKGYKAAGTGTLVTSLFLTPLVGLMPAIACSTTPPERYNLNYPDEDKMKKSEYYSGYTQKAEKIKSGKVWKNWGISWGIQYILILIVTIGASGGA
jgi:hypothetical protein